MRTLLFIGALLTWASAASACDVCGCSIGGNYFGILPQFHRHFVGLRYSEQSFRSAHSTRAAQSGIFDSDEQFRTLDVLGRFYPLRRLQVFVLAPYHDFTRIENGTRVHTQGLGDLSLMGNWIALDTGDSLRTTWQHTLTIGGGIKLPTGGHAIKDAEGQTLHPNLQPGTGSTDVMLSATYTLRRGAWGFSSDVLGRLNTANHHDYQFGNRVSGSAKFFYWKNFRKVAFLPNIGVFADASAPNREDGWAVDQTGGNILLGTLGLDCYAGNFSVGLTVQPPISQHLGDGAIEANTRWMLTSNYIF